MNRPKRTYEHVSKRRQAGITQLKFCIYMGLALLMVLFMGSCVYGGVKAITHSVSELHAMH